MFSENRKISLRQTYRLFVFDLLGVGTLLLPTQLAGLCGNDGIWCILLGGALGILYLLLLGAMLKKMRMDLLAYMRTHMAKGLRKLLLCWLALYSLLFSGFCGSVFVDLVHKSLIPEESRVLILGVLLLVAAYAVSGGMESRGRVYEILFLFVLIPLVIMFIGAARDVDVQMWQPIFVSKPGNVLKGAYLVFMAFSVVFYMVFFPSVVEEKRQKRLVLSVGLALGIVLLILMVLYLILVGSFGARALAKMKYPVVTLMSTVQIKGNFFKRADALMLGVWFFTLFALMNLHIFYTGKMCEELVGKKGNKRYLAGVVGVSFVVGLVFLYGDGMMERYVKLLERVGIPMLVLIPIMILLTGCNSTELEDRCFPLLAAVDKEQNQVVFSYEFPRVGIKSKEGQEVAELGLAPVKEDDFKAAKAEYERQVSKQPDANHLKVILLGENFVEDRRKYEEMLDFLQQSESFPRNTYVCVTASVEEVLKLDEHSSMDLGSYIEELIENHERNRDGRLTTIGDLMDEKENRRRILKLPYLEVDNETIVWRKECVLK